MWVRGLKPRAQYSEESAVRSHPMWVRGLKHQRDTVIVQVIESHPMWVRGLKPHIFEGAMPPVSRTPCGCVD